MQNVENVMSVLDTICQNMILFREKGVQTQFIANKDAITIEFAAYRMRYSNVSMIIFFHDYKKTLPFVSKVIERLKNEEDVLKVIEESAREYRENHRF